jgi:diguanylate cyclase (GGDEF)-like protein
MSDRLAYPLLLALAAVSVFTIDRAGASRAAERFLTEVRMAAAPREASGDIVFVAIDSRSVREVGTWPWKRETHAELLRRLVDLGATEILFDIDFSTPSDPDSDKLFADALMEAGGKVVLSAFKQEEGVDASGGPLAETLPLDAFRERAWLASVNMAPGPDGRIWRYPLAQDLEHGRIASAAAVLAERFGAPGADFAVNYAIAPSTVPVHAAIDVLEGRIGHEAIEGRSVVFGAHAAELRDNIAVPVHGPIPGALVHVLAAETLAADIALVPIREVLPFLAVAVLAAAFVMSPLGRRVSLVTSVFGATALAVEASALVLQARWAFVLPTPVLHATLLAIGSTALAREFDLRRWLAERLGIEARNGQRVLRRVIADSSDAVIVVEETGRILEMSARAQALFGGCGGREARDFRMLLPAKIAEMALEVMSEFRAGRADRREEQRIMLSREERDLHFDIAVTPSRIEPGDAASAGGADRVIACVTMHDVTLAHEQKLRLEHLARFDVLTGALNRKEFLARLDDRLSTHDHAVFAIKLHRFKTINATLGRRVGDSVLCALATRIEGVDQRFLGAARLGGDVFAVACADVGRAEAEALANAIVARASDPFELEGTTAHVSARVGVALAPRTESASAALDQAEQALDAARENAGPPVRHYEPWISSTQERSRQIERALWSAIEDGEFFLAYQPQVELQRLRVVGAEALARWRHRSMGDISPAEFIPVAESSGFIEHLGRWVLRRACRDAVSWAFDIPVAVNVSPLQLQHGDVIADVRQALDESGLAPERLCLEITESSFVSRSNEVVNQLLALRRMGVRLALDDFGAGFSSFGYLARLPLDKLKLDRMFARDLESNGTTGAIIASVVALCRELGFELLCEGVESTGQATLLSSLGCQQAQGYHFGKPQPADELFPRADDLRSEMAAA